jgi:hypothetical protein
MIGYGGDVGSIAKDRLALFHEREPPRQLPEWRLVHRHANRLEDQYLPSSRLKPARGA